MTLSISFSRYFFAALVNLLASYGLMLFLLTVLAKAEYGQYGIYLSLFSILLILFNFGHKEVMFKYASQSAGAVQAGKLRRQGGSDWLNTTWQSFFLWNLMWLVLVQVLLLVDMTWYWLALMFLANSWLVTAAACHRGKANYAFDAFALSAQRSLWLVFCGLWFWFSDGLDLRAVFVSSLLASLLCMVWLYLPLLAVLPGPRSLLTGQDKKHWRLLSNYLLIEVASVFYLKADVLLLRGFGQGLSTIADYFFAIQLFEIAVLFIMPVGYFYFNRVSAHVVTGSVNSVGMKSYVAIIVGLVALMQLVTFLLAPVIFPLLLPQYTDSINTVLWVMFALYPVALNILLSTRLIVANKEVVWAKICLIALLVNLLGNCLLIPRLGIQGAIYIKLLTELLITCLAFWVLSRDKMERGLQI